MRRRLKPSHSGCLATARSTAAGWRSTAATRLRLRPASLSKPTLLAQLHQLRLLLQLQLLTVPAALQALLLQRLSQVRVPLLLSRALLLAQLCLACCWSLPVTGICQPQPHRQMAGMTPRCQPHLHLHLHLPQQGHASELLPQQGHAPAPAMQETLPELLLLLLRQLLQLAVLVQLALMQPVLVARQLQAVQAARQPRASRVLGSCLFAWAPALVAAAVAVVAAAVVLEVLKARAPAVWC